MTLDKKVKILQKIRTYAITLLTVVVIVLAAIFMVRTYRENIDMMQPFMRMFISGVLIILLVLRLINQGINAIYTKFVQKKEQ